jgi:hypothetical protein
MSFMSFHILDSCDNNLNSYSSKLFTCSTIFLASHFYWHCFVSCNPHESDSDSLFVLRQSASHVPFFVLMPGVQCVWKSRKHRMME